MINLPRFPEAVFLRKYSSWILQSQEFFILIQSLPFTHSSRSKLQDFEKHMSKTSLGQQFYWESKSHKDFAKSSSRSDEDSDFLLVSRLRDIVSPFQGYLKFAFGNIVFKFQSYHSWTYKITMTMAANLRQSKVNDDKKALNWNISNKTTSFREGFEKEWDWNHEMAENLLCCKSAGTEVPSQVRFATFKNAKWFQSHVPAGNLQIEDSFFWRQRD